MKKRFLFLVFLMGILFTFASISYNVKAETKGCNYTDFTNQFSWGQMQPTCELDNDGNTVIIIEPSAWGQRLRYRYELDYTDMLLDFNIQNMANGEVIVFLFTINNESWIGDTENFVVRFYRGGKNEADPVASNEINIIVGPNHDPANQAIGLSARYVEGDNPFVIQVTKDDDYEFALSYRSVDTEEFIEDDIYTVSNDVFSTWITGDEPKGGLVIGGFERPGGAEPAKIVFYEVSDTFSRNYEETIKQDIETAVSNYELATFTNVNDLPNFLNLRETALDLINSKARVYDKSGFIERINAKDELIKNDEILTGIVADKVIEQLSDLAEELEVFGNEENITESKLAELQNSLDTIFDEALSYKTLLSSEKQTEIITEVENIQYVLTKTNILLTIITYEQAVEAEEYGKVTPERIVELKALKQKVDVEKLAKLKEDDKVTLETRFEEVNTLLEELENSISGDVKELYISTFEEAVEEDLTKYENILLAIEERNNVYNNVTFTETDSELEERFNVANNKLNVAIDAYILTELDNLVASFNDKEALKDYKNYKTIADKFKAIDLTIIAENSNEKENIEAKYEIVKTLLENHILYGFSHVGMDELYVTNEGIYTKGAAEHPRRTNFNLPFNIINSEVIVRFSEIAYYNVDDDEPDKGANNIVINLLNKPNATKSADNTYGFSIMFWMFPQESNVHVYNNTDISLGSVGIPTPLSDEDVVIKISIEELYGSEYWVIDINGYVIEIPTSGPAGVSKDIFEDNMAYFSIASYADVKTEKNAYTIVKIGEYEFGEKQDEPHDDENDNDNDNNNENNEEKEDKKFNAIPLVIAGVVVLVGSGTYAFIRFRQK